MTQDQINDEAAWKRRIEDAVLGAAAAAGLIQDFEAAREMKRRGSQALNEIVASRPVVSP